MGRLDIIYKDGMKASFEVNNRWYFVEGEGLKKIDDFFTKSQILETHYFTECGHCDITFEVGKKRQCDTCKKKKDLCQDCFESQDAFHVDGDGETEMEIVVNVE
jgi:hypothetical protein